MTISSYFVIGYRSEIGWVWAIYRPILFHLEIYFGRTQPESRPKLILHRQMETSTCWLTSGDADCWWPNDKTFLLFIQLLLFSLLEVFSFLNTAIWKWKDNGIMWVRIIFPHTLNDCRSISYCLLGQGRVCLFVFQAFLITVCKIGSLKICCRTWVAGVGPLLGVGYLWWVDHCIQP